jgi:hypothetical protein
MKLTYKHIEQLIDSLDVNRKFVQLSATKQYTCLELIKNKWLAFGEEEDNKDVMYITNEGRDVLNSLVDRLNSHVPT